mmetsp:Transcript_6818/g.17420  ORF Transcript_6818/g.17420 Transcript_6818/m.17420 type:complete len:187 (-) Transcript_6818:391-951(-)
MALCRALCRVRVPGSLRDLLAPVPVVPPSERIGRQMAIMASCSSQSSSSSTHARHVTGGSGFSDVLGDASPSIRITGYDSKSFVVNGNSVSGSMFCYEGKFLLWNVESLGDVNPAVLSVLQLVRPKPEVLVVGSGSRFHPISREVKEFLYEQNIGHEVSDTPTAISTFNILQQEGRRVAAALIPVD